MKLKGILLLLVFLIGLAAAAGWNTAYAAPLSGAAPSLEILSGGGSTLLLEFDRWTPGLPLKLRYTKKECITGTSLPDPGFEINSDQFQVTYTLPGMGIQPGTYYLCASDSLGEEAMSDRTFTIVESIEPISPVAPTPTPKPSPVSPTKTPTISKPIKSPTATSTPGNGGTSVGASNSSGGALIAIIVLCLLVLALLVYLVRLWLRGRQPPPPPGGGTPNQNP